MQDCLILLSSHHVTFVGQPQAWSSNTSESSESPKVCDDSPRIVKNNIDSDMLDTFWKQLFTTLP